MATRRKGLPVALAASLLAAASFAALMQHSETTIAMPATGEKTPLEKLEYRARFAASVDSVTVRVSRTRAPIRWSPTGSSPGRTPTARRIASSWS